ncbi:MAG: phosphopantetheine-binding protein, partial [Planctomycetia bacterium]
IREMTETVSWIVVVDRLYAAGVRTFVEVGPSGVLTGLTRRILEGRENVTFVQFDQRGRAPREHLARLREQLAAAGALGGRGAAVVAPAASVVRPVAPGRLVSFDATARRRERNRSGGAARPAARPAVSTPEASHDAGQPLADVAAQAGGWQATSSTPRSSGNGAQVLEPAGATATAVRMTPQSADRFLEDVVADLLAEAGVEPPLARAGAGHQGVRAFLDAAGHLFEIAPADHATVLAAGSRDALCDVLARSGGKARWLARKQPTPSVADGVPPSGGAGPDAAEIEAFLIDFVVEQTGYPREIVELGADLEADLGIDSIRKAQLFGEIGQKYGLTADDSVSLDEFPTLRHLLDYLLPRVGANRGGPAPTAVQAPARPQPVHSAAFTRGLERGREHAAAIATWAKQMVATGVTTDGVAFEPAVEEELAGAASAAGVEPAVVRAAFAEPAWALGGCDAVIVAPAVASAPRAAIVCLGRHADPAIRRFEANGLRGGLAGVKGLPGAVFGWNDAGLVAVAPDGCDGAATIACEQVLATCRSIGEAERMIATLARAPRGLVVAAIAGGGFTVTAAGRAEPIAAVVQRADARSPLARVLWA